MKVTSMLLGNLQHHHSRKIAKHIEIVGSPKARLNTMARTSRETILDTLRKQYTEVGVTLIADMDDLRALVAKNPDLVVLGMNMLLLEPEKGYEASSKLWVSEYLEANGIACTGSDTAALKLQFDKQDAKQTAIDAGLNSSAFFTSTMANPTFEHSLQFPLFVKPTDRGGSKGVDEQSVVYTQADLSAKIRSIHLDFASDALVEEYLPGREFSVAVVRRPGTGELLSMPIEIAAPADESGHSFLSGAVKAADSEEVLMVQEGELRNSVNELAIGVFNALGARDYGRIDMRLDGQGNPSFIEANLMPGLSNHGYLSRCFYMNERVTYHDMILAIVALGLRRNGAEKQALTEESPLILSPTVLAGTVPTA